MLAAREPTYCDHLRRRRCFETACGKAKRVGIPVRAGAALRIFPGVYELMWHFSLGRSCIHTHLGKRPACSDGLNCLVAVFCMHSTEDPMYMILHGLFGEIQAGGNLLVCPALFDKRKELLLSAS